MLIDLPRMIRFAELVLAYQEEPSFDVLKDRLIKEGKPEITAEEVLLLSEIMRRGSEATTEDLVRFITVGTDFLLMMEQSQSSNPLALLELAVRVRLTNGDPNDEVKALETLEKVILY